MTGECGGLVILSEGPPPSPGLSPGVHTAREDVSPQTAHWLTTREEGASNELRVGLPGGVLPSLVQDSVI